MAPIDRIEDLRGRNDFAGLDFVFVSSDQRTLSVFFHPNNGTNAQQILGVIPPAQITIYSPTGGQPVPVLATAWGTLGQRRVLVVTTQPGDFSRYRLRIDHPQIDPYFREAAFSFKANCPSELDCEPPPHECPDEALVDYAINYTARDFWSIRQALIDFASDRHPAWKDRLEADLGMMLLEVMSALGDEAAYYQDRISRETYFESASQRRSLRRHARLVDYQLHDGKGGSTWLDFTVNAAGVVGAGTQVWIRPPAVPGQDAPAQRRGRSASVYEAGRGLAQGPPNYRVDPDVNGMPAYQWDSSDACLLAGSTSLYVAGHHAAALTLDDFTNPYVPGKFVVLRTNPNDAAVPVRVHLVRLVRVTDAVDPLTATNITHLEWEPKYATPFEMELESLVVRGNVVPATAGETLEAQFRIEPVPQAAVPFPPAPAHAPAANALYDEHFSSYAVERSAKLFTLPGSEQRALVWHGPDARHAAPEVQLFEGVSEWEWRRALLGVVSAEPGEQVFTLDDGAWRRVASYRRVDETGQPQEMIHYDYAAGAGTTIRFGNGDFGEEPARGTDFRAVYRLGHGRRDDIAADSLDDFDDVAFPFIAAVSNPFGVVDAVDPESASEVRQVAPDAYRAETFRAVRAEDYAAAAEKLPWVQRAGAQFRWTGSWPTIFATPDPRGSFAMAPDERRDLERQLDRYRQAGREAYALDPKFANIDLEIHVCVAPSAFVGDVKESLLEALFGTRGVRARAGFFSPDRWTFGDPLERAALEAVIQSVPGVRAVESIFIRRRGWFERRLFEELVYRVAADEIVRIENDPDFPERGAVRLVMEGGA